MQEPKLVSIEPNFGGTGTSVVIKGEHFGECIDDIVSLLICGINCTPNIKWISSRCIKAFVVNNYKARSGVGEVTMVTRSGGKCLSSLTFELNITRVNVLEESDFWIDEAIESLLPAMDEKDAAPVDTFEPDPLGIITSDASISAKTKAAINDIINQFGLTGSPSLFDENFNVNKFLVVRHYNSSWDDLKKGLGFLREILHIQQNKQESHSWLLNSSTVLVDMMNGLHALSGFTQRTTISPEDVHRKSEDCYETANNAFSCILRQQQDIEKLKQTIQLIDTYDYFFNLPSLFERALHTKNYQSAMDNLEQVKTLLEPMPHKESIMQFFQRYIELLKSDIWKELTECSALSNLKLNQHPNSNYLHKYINRCSALQAVSMGESLSGGLSSSVSKASAFGRAGLCDAGPSTPRKDQQHQWKTYNEQLTHMFQQQHLIQYLNVLDPSSCNLWLYICELEKNITTLISNSENIFIAVHVRKIKEIFSASESGFFSYLSTAPTANNSLGAEFSGPTSVTNKQAVEAIFSAERRQAGGVSYLRGGALRERSSSITPAANDEFISNGTADDDLFSSHIDAMVMFVVNYCDNYYNKLCDFMCACHCYVDKNSKQPNFATNYNDSIAMIVQSVENYFSALSNMLFEVELGGARTNLSHPGENQASDPNGTLATDIQAEQQRPAPNLHSMDSIDHDTTAGQESGGELLITTASPIKIALMSLLSYGQLELLATKITSIFRVLPNLVDSVRYKPRKHSFNSSLLKTVLSKKSNPFSSKWISTLLANKSTILSQDKTPQDTTSVPTQLTTPVMETEPPNNDPTNSSTANIDLNGHNAITRIFHDLMYELCQQMFLVCSQFACDRLEMDYHNETWTVFDSSHREGTSPSEGSINEPIPSIKVDSNPFMTSSQSSQPNHPNPFLNNHPKNTASSSGNSLTTTQFPIDFHRQFIHWTLAVSYFLNPIIHSKCLEDIDVNQLRCHDSNIRKIFMVYYTQLVDTFKVVSTKKIVPTNFRNNNTNNVNATGNKNRDTIYLMIYCNVYYMLQRLLPLATKLFTAKNPLLSDIVPQTAEFSTLSELYDTFSEFSNTVLNQYVKVKFRSVLLPIVVSFSTDEGFLYSIHSNTVQSHVYNFMIRLMHFTKDIVPFKKSTHIEVMKRLCNSVAVIINDNVNKITSQIKPHIAKQQIINISTLMVVFTGYTDQESETLFNDSIRKLNTLQPNIDQNLISQTVSTFTHQHSTLLKSFHF